MPKTLLFRIPGFGLGYTLVAVHVEEPTEEEIEDIKSEMTILAKSYYAETPDGQRSQKGLRDYLVDQTFGGITEVIETTIHVGS